MATTKKTTPSTGESVSELANALDAVSRLEGAARFWDNLRLGLILFAALLGLLSFGATYLSARRARDLGEAKSVLSRLELAERDRKIAETRLATEQQRERAAKAEKDLLEVQNKLILQGSRHMLLYGENRGKLVAALKPFSGQKIEIRYCDQDKMDREVISLTHILTHTFELSGWESRFPVMANCGGSGISVGVTPDANDSTRKGANALLAALVGVPLVVIGPAVVTLNKAEIELQQQGKTFDNKGTELKRFSMGPELIVVTVYAHPL